MNKLFSMLAIVIAVVAGTAVAASPVSRPPSEYGLDEVRLELKHSIYRMIASVPVDERQYEDTSTILGNGQGQYEEKDGHNSKESTFMFEPETVRQLVRELYEARIFDMRDDYSGRPEIHFDPSGKVRAIETIATHQWNITLTIVVGEYRKTIVYDSHGVAPKGLAQFVAKLETLIAKHVPGVSDRW